MAGGVTARRVFGWGLLAAVQAALWLAFAGQVDKYEVTGALVGSLLATGAVGFVHWARPVHGVPLFRDILKVWRVPWEVVQGMWTICVAMTRKLLRGEEGEAVVTCYAPAGGGNREGARHDAARRMLMTTFTTATPGSIIVGILKHGRRVVVHQVTRRQSMSGMVTSMQKEHP
jgi:hypothetical protein